MSFTYGEQPTFGEQQPAAMPFQQEAQPSHDELSILKAPVAMEQTLSALAENQHPMTQPLNADEIFKPVAAPIAPEAPVAPMAPVLTVTHVPTPFETTQSLSARVAEMESRNSRLEQENMTLRSEIAALSAQLGDVEALRSKAEKLESAIGALQALTAQLQG